jgi:predicted nucleotidyltransferase
MPIAQIAIGTDPELIELLPPDYTPILAYRGSLAHNMFVPSTDPTSIDDIDLMGIAVGPPETYFGLHEWGSRGTKDIKRGKWDIVFYEIRKMFSLLLQGNPNVLSLLWCRKEDYLKCDEVGRRIIGAREYFVGRHVYNAFAGYAHAQLEKMETREPSELREYMAVTAEMKHRGIHPNHKGEVFPEPKRDTGEARDVMNWDSDKLVMRLRHYQKKGENLGYLGEKRKGLVLEHGYDSKNAAHLIRLLRMCIEFMKNGELQVWRKDADELLAIKRGLWPLARIKAHADELFLEAKSARDASSLSLEPRAREAEALLVSITKEHFC